MPEIELYLQGEGIPVITLVRVPDTGTVRDILEVAVSNGLSAGANDAVVFIEDAEEPLELDIVLERAGIRHRGRVHVHRCRRVEVTVNFNAEHETHPFPPSATMRRVKEWADKRFKLQGVDATDHVLQRCGSAERPDEDIHIGTLVQVPDCALCFDLVPKQRVEG